MSIASGGFTQETPGRSSAPADSYLPLLRAVKVKTFDEADIATLETEVTTWLEARTQERLVELSYDFISGAFTCVIFYTE